MKGIGPQILEVDGVPEFVVLRYDEYQRLLALAAASSARGIDVEDAGINDEPLLIGDDLTTPTTDRSALSLPEEISYPPAPDDGLIPHEVIVAAVHNHWSLVRAWREYLGLNQLAVAQRLGISVSEYEQMEGEFEPLRSPRRERLAQGLGVKEQLLVPRRRRLRRSGGQ